MTDGFDWPWDDGADVVIAGAGGAGLMAALTAAERGASVLVLEKAANIGGKTAMAIGSFTASETQIQREAGIADRHGGQVVRRPFKHFFPYKNNACA